MINQYFIGDREKRRECNQIILLRNYRFNYQIMWNNLETIAGVNYNFLRFIHSFIRTCYNTWYFIQI